MKTYQVEHKKICESGNKDSAFYNSKLYLTVFTAVFGIIIVKASTNNIHVTNFNSNAVSVIEESSNKGAEIE